MLDGRAFAYGSSGFVAAENRIHALIITRKPTKRITRSKTYKAGRTDIPHGTTTGARGTYPNTSVKYLRGRRRRHRRRGRHLNHHFGLRRVPQLRQNS